MSNSLLVYFMTSVLIFLILFIYLGQALWVYQDSKRRGDDYAWLWTILCLTNFPVPLIIYLLVTRQGKRKCRNCNKRIDKSLKTCPYCGENSSNLCPRCSRIVEDDWNYCPNCNEKVK